MPRKSRIAHAAACGFACGLIGVLMVAQPVARAEVVAATNGNAQPMPIPSGATFTLAANGAQHGANGATGAGGANSASTPNAAPAPAKGPNCTGPIADHQSVDVPVGKSTLVNVPEPVRARTVGNPMILQAMLVSQQTLYLLGLDVGTTNMIVQGRSGSCSIIDVNVGSDPAGLQNALNVLMPEEKDIHVRAAADNLVLTGTVSDSAKLDRVLQLARAFSQRPNAALPAASSSAPQGVASMQVSFSPMSSGSSGQVKNEHLINMLRVTAPQQVMLEVKVAEVSKTLIDQLGVQTNLQGAIGSWSFGLLADFVSGGLAALVGSKANNRPLNFAIDAQKTDQLVKILAEPNLMAISGQEASFLAGGKVFIPVPQSNSGGGQTIVLQEETFGVGLTFTPTVLEGGRINLKVAPEVSELSPTGVAVTTGTTEGTAILPLITTRRASTTIQLFDGQSFAIGGLIKNNVSGTLKALPGAGEVPVLGALFRSNNFQSDKTELVFVVTPRIAKPLQPNYPLPTDSFGDVNEAHVLATGNMEGTKHVAPATATPGAPAAPVAPAAPASALPAPDTTSSLPPPQIVPTPDDAPSTSASR
ncbi:MAG TPA: type II and III secretion system protein family protein [Pararobbsia sp.]|nr:type II and III secretion system protein family protein [Pararobbsia sp.]